MAFAEFIDRVPSITLYDPLSQVLGAFEDGKITFSYREIIKFAGHSCPTVAGAYTIARLGLSELYPDKLPVRGEVNVLLKNSETNETTGVIGAVLGAITGAAGKGGFKGLSGKFSRANRLGYEADIPGDIRLVRTDTEKAIDIKFSLNSLPQDPSLAIYFPKALVLDREALPKFWEAWHLRVKAVLFENDRYDFISFV